MEYPEGDKTALFDLLRDRNVLETVDGDDVQMTASFSKELADRKQEVDGMTQSERSEQWAPYAEGIGVTVDDISQRLLSTVLALEQRKLNLDPIEVVGVALSVDSILAGNEHGVPAGFSSVAAENVIAFINVFPAAILYCWRKDCDPCDVVRADLEQLFEAGKLGTEIGLGAVYGPDAPAFLNERLSVVGAPTLLFCLNGSVDSRLIGAVPAESIHGEVEVIASSLRRS